MPTLNTSFKTFLSNIEPNPETKKYAQEAHKPVREYLKNDEVFGEFFVDSFLYGSYARNTAVGDIKDVDIVVVTNFDPKNSEHTPQVAAQNSGKRGVNKRFAKRRGDQAN